MVIITSNPDKVRPIERLRWIDQGRGFILFLLVLTMVFPPSEWKPEGSIMFWFFGHPGNRAKYMTLYDVGAAAFIFIMGLTFSISFRQRIQRQGMTKAIWYVVVRYCMVLLLGILFVLVWSGNFTLLEYNKEFGIEVVKWDVIPTLGLVGFVTLPFTFIQNPKIRVLIAYVWMILYQLLMIFFGLKTYAQASFHGGIFGALFGYSGIMIVATALGDYVFYSSIEDSKKYVNLIWFGLCNIIGGLVISFIPGWEAAKLQVSFAHCVISIGIIVLGLLIFVYLDRVKNVELKYFQAFGRNPFLTYLLAETLPYTIYVNILDVKIGPDLGAGPLGNILVTALILSYTSILMWYLYKKNIIISTEKVGAIFIIIGIIFAFYSHHF